MATGRVQLLLLFICIPPPKRDLSAAGRVQNNNAQLRGWVPNLLPISDYRPLKHLYFSKNLLLEASQQCHLEVHQWGHSDTEGDKKNYCVQSRSPIHSTQLHLPISHNWRRGFSPSVLLFMQYPSQDQGLVPPDPDWQWMHIFKHQDQKDGSISIPQGLNNSLYIEHFTCKP